MPIIQRIEVRCDLMGLWLFYFMEKFASILDGRYLLSSYGYIVPQQGKRKYKKMYGTKDTAGYIVFGLLTNDGIHKKLKAHRILAESFISNPKGKAFVNHINGNTLDNSLDNLEWCTHSENMTHSGKVLKTKRPRVLDSVSVLDIREKYKNGYTIKDIRKVYNSVTYSAIYNAASGKTWKFI